MQLREGRDPVWVAAGDSSQYLACLRHRVNISWTRELFQAGSGFVCVTSALPTAHNIGVVTSSLVGGAETVVNGPWLHS